MLALAGAQIIAWASAYYIFPALLLHMEADLGWSKATLTGAFTVALLATAASAPLAGRLIDRGHGGWLLPVSVLATAAALAALAATQGPWQFYLVWAAIGCALAGALYEPCFAVLIRRHGTAARPAITRITLVGGFAGTLAFPLGHLLGEAVGWRTTVLLAAGAVALVAAPLMWFGLRGTPDRAETQSAAAPSPAQRQRDDAHVRQTVRSSRFRLLAAAFSMMALNHAMMITHLRPLLDERGVAPALGVLAASLFGPMQVAGRIALLSAGERLRIPTVCLISFASVSLAATLLYVSALAMFVTVSMLLVFTFIALQGAGYGVTSITRPLVTAELLGRTGFGQVSGAQTLVYMGAFAVAPAVGGVLHEVAGYDAVLLLCAGLGIGGYVCFARAAAR